jgi:hypothetical protein
VHPQPGQRHGPGGWGQGYDALKQPSNTFRALYNPAGLRLRILQLTTAEALRQAAMDAATAEREQQRDQRAAAATAHSALRKELKNLPRDRHTSSIDTARATELTAAIGQRDTELRRLDAPLKEHGTVLKTRTAEATAASKDHAVLEAHRTKYEAIDRSVTRLETETTALPTTVAAREAQIACSQRSEQESAALGDEGGARAERRVRSGLQKELTRRRTELARKTAAVEKKRSAREAEPLRAYGARGILNLPKEVLEALIGVGLRWGGNWRGAKDFMHFDR